MSQHNSICDLVCCVNWDSVANSNDELPIVMWNKKCQECYHSKNPDAKKCNYFQTDRM